ncbi:Wzz/FepE/Etk N-terminal domain-containing protein [Polynucleobacter acidiphobus]|uniref:Wzz/FepE/Etk N-terminal domain-containing protein n=1 Tax=Polynucleobacter acidiphobus TaxID=556053 RepID=UPI000D3C56D3|nr:Wzz/FepE/Etk N-terminal domain-containing protein [Polynucleobacter acidiphobus]
MPINDSQSTPSAQLDDELSLLDIIEFMQESWKTIVGFTVLGIAGAGLYLWAVPKQYEASAQIKMAQIANFNNNNNINPLGINIEEPQALIVRMALPTSYPKETIALCGMVDQKDPELTLASKAKLSIPKGVGGTVDLKVRDASKEIAKACTNAVYQLIKSSQAQLVAPYIDEASKKLKIEEERLGRATQVIAKADKSGAAVSAAYLATRDEIRYLLDQISNLQSIITGNESRAAHLTAPIYLKDEPVFPQKRNSLLIGLLLGGLLGLVFTLARKWYRSNRTALKH